MAQTDPRSSGDTDPGEQRQVTLEEFNQRQTTNGGGVLVKQCQAMSVRYSRQCQRDALPGTDYCATHHHQQTDKGDHANDAD